MGMNRRGFKRMTRALLLGASLSLTAGFNPVPAHAADALVDQMTFSIPPQALESALTDFANQAKLQLIVSHDLVAGLSSPGIQGEFSIEAALKRLLDNSGLKYKMTGANTVTVFRGLDPAPAGAQSARPESNKAAASLTDVPLNEIVVTAEKREERLQDVPIPVSTLDGGALVGRNQLRLQDYASSVPSLNVTPIGAQSTQILSIRGINTGVAGNPSVGIVIDDVPYGSSTNLGGGPLVPDIDPFDLARLEVLRGPQGTLYGASSLGGLIKFVTVDPTTEGFSGRAEADTSTVYSAADPGYGFRAAVNIPVTDTFALRVSGFTRRDPGFIDSAIRDEKDLNTVHAEGGRVSGLFKPSSEFSLKLSALFQEIRADGSSDVDQSIPGFGLPPLGDLQQAYLPGVGGYTRKFQAYSAILNTKIGIADLTSVSGYNINAYHDSWDATYFLGQYAVPIFGVGGGPATDENKTRKFSQELRLSMPLGERVDWLIGGFYTHESSTYSDQLLAADLTTGQIAGSFLYNSFPTTYSEYAAFTDLTYKVTDQFDIQFGGRESEIRQTFTQTQTGPFAAPDIPKFDIKGDAFTYLVTPRFKFSPDMMVYLRLASGYRAGGANALIGGAATGLPLQYDPDKTQSYEVGLKGDVMDHRLSVDASLYYIDWKHIQLTLSDAASAQSYVTNAGHAKSQGIELSGTAKPMLGLTLSAWVDWNTAVLKEGFPAPSTAAGGVYGVPGDPLPYASRFSGNFSADEHFDVTNKIAAFVGASISYVGRREGEFSPPPVRQSYAGYAKTDLRAGASFDAWNLNLALTNLADRRGLLGGGLGSFPPYGFTIIQPRTLSLSLSTTF